jgi:hypothetical protein
MGKTRFCEEGQTLQRRIKAKQASRWRGGSTDRKATRRRGYAYRRKEQIPKLPEQQDSRRRFLQLEGVAASVESE